MKSPRQSVPIPLSRPERVGQGAGSGFKAISATGQLEVSWFRDHHDCLHLPITDDADADAIMREIARLR